MGTLIQQILSWYKYINEDLAGKLFLINNKLLIIKRVWSFCDTFEIVYLVINCEEL